jgi:competence ComEA-like helix-hairpin-helix protein
MELAPDRTNPLQTFWETWRWVICLAAGSTAAICVAIVLLVQTAQIATPIEFIGGATLGAETEGGQGILVDIEGAVASPGAKMLPVGSRVEDALRVAGGFTGDADLEYTAKILNRAQIVSDGMKIYIPFVQDSKTSYNMDILSRREDTSYNISSDIQNPDGQVGPLISINSGTVAELDTLAGVGPVTANKIISNRPYKTLEDLINKKAIGVSLFEKIKSRLAL